jgi:streptogramin lyase
MPRVALAGAITGACLLAGCATKGIPAVSVGTGIPFQGNVHAGSTPVSGASVSFYAAGSSGNGVGAVDLLNGVPVKTDTSGNFTVSGDYTCPSATTQVYLVARGGKPLVTNPADNPSLALMAAIGDCANLTSSSSITINELTTVAATWSLRAFLAPGGMVGASSTNTMGLANAFLVANNLVNLTSGTTPGSALPAGSILETAKLDTLANALTASAISAGGSACPQLFTAATETGEAPTNTLDAAFNIVANPASNVAAVYSLASAKGAYQPALTAAPHDWTLSITYGGCASGCGGLHLPGGLAIGATGSVWVANYSGGYVSKFSATGVPAAPTGYHGAGLHDSFGIAVDGQGNAWVTNEESVSASVNGGLGSVSKFSASGVELSGEGFTGGGIYFPQAIAADTNGDLWVANYGQSSASLLASDGTPLSGASGLAASQLPFTSAVALDASHTAWFAVQGAAASVSPTGAVVSYPCCDNPSGIAVDPNGNIWLADYGASSIVELSHAGEPLHQLTLAAGANAPNGIASDSAGNIWTSNYRGDSVTEIAGAGAALLSPAKGFGQDAPLDEPFGVAIDAGGNVWVTNSGNDTITEILGIAAPVKTPLLGPPSQP